MDSIRAEVAIIGAGPAGSTLAALLARRGIDTILLERDDFPRDKLCGEFLSWDALPVLERIGVLASIDAAGASRISRGVIVASSRNYELRFPGVARGVSRRLLDRLLVERAAALGAHVLTRRTVESIERREHQCTIRCRTRAGEIESIESRVLIGAWGRWGRLDRILDRDFITVNKRHFGFKRHYEQRGDSSDTIALYSYGGGYLGASPIEGARLNICGLVDQARMKGMMDGWDGFVRRIRGERSVIDSLFSQREPAQPEFLSCEPVIFAARDPVQNGVILIGDASGIVDPLAGNGMAMAIQSALLAAGTVLQRLSGGAIADNANDWYRHTHSLWFDSRIRWSRRAARLLSRPRLLDAAIASVPVARVGEILVRKTRGDLQSLHRLLDAWER